MKKNKKKILVLALLLFTFVGVIGYGVYSYYYTEGTVDTVSASDESSDNVIRITGSFNPTVESYASSGSSGSGSSGGFLGSGGTVYLDCPETTGGHETITCSATMTVRNEGSTGIYVYYYDTYSYASSSDATVDADSPDLYWSGEGSSETYISSGSSATLNISVDVNVGSTSSISDSEAQLVTEPISSGSLSASVSFRLHASQNSNY